MMVNRAAAGDRIRAESRASPCVSIGLSVLAHLDRRRGMHKPPDLCRFVHLDLILHQHLSPLAQLQAAPNSLRVMGIGRREIGNRRHPSGSDWKASNPRIAVEAGANWRGVVQGDCLKEWGARQR
jgi:hypothetical protein